MAKELPNFSQMAGAVIGAKILSKIGSKKRLAFLPASTIQIVGAEKALFLHFKKGIKAAGFDIKDGDSAIVPIMLYDAALSQKFADKLLDEGIYVIGFFYPVVPKEQARIRVQLSAAHETSHLDKAIAAFTKVGKELGVIS